MSGEIRLRVGVLDGDDPDAWPPFGRRMDQEQARLGAAVRQVPAIRTAGKRLRADLLIAKDLRGESALNEMIGLFIDGTDFASDTLAIQITSRNQQIQQICAVLKDKASPHYKRTGFHIWLHVNEAADVEKEKMILETLHTWALSTAETLEITRDDVSIQRIWTWDNLTSLFGAALEAAAHKMR